MQSNRFGKVLWSGDLRPEAVNGGTKVAKRLPRWRAGVLALMALAAFHGHATVMAVPETGNHCVEDGPAGSVVCTANDGGVSSFNSATVTDGCVNTTGDTATLSFVFNVTAGSPKRYDHGFFIDLTGTANGARDGDNCYHDFFEPPLSASNPPPGPPYLNNNNDNDQCGDIDSNQTWQKTTSSMTITCADLNSNTLYDVSFCVSYDNNTGGTCNDVTGAYPSTGSKCQCYVFDIASPTAITATDLTAASGGSNGLLIATLLGLVAAGIVLVSRRNRVAGPLS